MSKLKPTGITADREKRELKISWNDGHESSYPFAGLRAECPCAECKGGHEKMGVPPNPYTIREAPNGDINIENIEAVGSYAITIHWSDGHWAGIYTWDFLRHACPCLQCAPALNN